MNRETVLTHTTSDKASTAAHQDKAESAHPNARFLPYRFCLIKENLLKALTDPSEAMAYLEAALLAYEEEKSTEALLLAMRDVAKAQGGIGKLAKRVGITREHLYSVLASQHNPRLDNLLSILSGLGFRVRLELKEGATAS